MGLALAKIAVLLTCFGGAVFFIRDARRNLREGRALFAASFLADGKIQNISRDGSPGNFHFVVGLKVFVAAVLLIFGLVYLWFGLAG